MPSKILQNLSGGELIISGLGMPVGGIQFLTLTNAGSNVYLGLSGGMTINSGGQNYSGLMDGIPIRPNSAFFLPKVVFPRSGVLNLFAGTDLAGSGSARLFWEIF